MSGPDWARVKEVFHEALDVEAPHRAAFLDERCPEAPELRREVEGLLAHLDASADFLEQPVVELAASLAMQPDDLPGSRIGPYRIVEELGRGGMGVVYLARRDDQQFEQVVAIKVVKRGMDTDEILRRFRAERQILARIHHPNIASLLDGGVTADGRPYVVMEYIDGVPITEYCHTRRLGLENRIRLFLEACGAVEHAHRSLILHRDLKPSNVLVQGDGSLKLLDFGIAKVLKGDPQDGLEWTDVGPLFLTLAYASPEQLRGEPLGTASDVYSLGIVLYQLLTGRRPYETAGLSREGAESVVLTARPPRPSAVAEPRCTPDPTPDPRARQRIRRALRGDLDTITLKALRKEPDRRYGSVAELAEDLRRYLSGRPVLARGDALAYRFGKFAGRHRVGLGLTAVALVGLTAAGLTYVRQSMRIAQERDKARLATELMIQMFQGADPLGPGGDTVTARTLLDRGRRRVEEELSSQPEVQAELLDAMGRAYHNLGLFEDAEGPLRKALELRRSLLDPRDPALSTSLHNLGVLLDQRGQYDEAQALQEEALALRRETLVPPNRELATSLNHLGRLLLYARGDPGAAGPLLREALDMRRALLPKPDLELAESVHDVALLSQAQGDLVTAAELYRESLDMRRELLGSGHPQTTPSVNNLALVLHTLGRYGEAEPLLRESLETRVAGLGPSHPSVAIAMANLGLLLSDRGDYPAAESLYRDALVITRGSFGPSHPRTATIEHNLADLLRLEGRPDEAEVLYLASLATRRAALGERHPHVAFSLHGLGLLRLAEGNLAAADTLLEASLALRESEGASSPGDVAQSAHGLGLVRLERGRLDEAEALLGRALEIRTREFGPGHPAVGDSELALARLARVRGRSDEAESRFQRATRIRAAAFGADHWKTLEVEALTRRQPSTPDR